MQDRVLSSEGLASTPASAPFDHGSLPICQSSSGFPLPSSSQARPQGFAFASASGPFDHGSLPIRPGVHGSSQSSIPQARPGASAQSNSQAIPIWYDRTPDSFGEPTGVAFICAKGVWDQLGLGDETPQDIQHYFEHKHYPARSTDDLEIDIEFLLVPKEGSIYTSPTVATHRASACPTLNKLFKRTKKFWRVVYQQCQSPFPATIQAGHLRVMVCETHGDAIYNWKSAYDPARYEKWYHDHVTHGRSKCLRLRLTYTEPMDE